MPLEISDIPVLNKNPLNYVFEKLPTLRDQAHSDPNKIWLEFGVWRGKTINYISQFTPRLMYGFDTFTGLPEKWRDGFEAGFFNLNGMLPPVNNNVHLFKGMFQDTLVPFLQHDCTGKRVSFVHVDCDLYSSTKFVLDRLRDWFADECIIVFDELINYPGFEHGELKALGEFLDENREAFSFEWIGRESLHTEPVAIKLLRIRAP